MVCAFGSQVLAFTVVAIVTLVMIVMIITTIAVIFTVPVAFMQPPALPFVVVVGMTPVCALVRLLFPSTGDPLVVATLRGPVPVKPDHAGAGGLSMPFITNGGRTGPDKYGNLGGSGNHQRHRKRCTD